MTKWRPVLYAIGLLLLGMLYVRACWEPSIRADERRRAGDRTDDSAIARLVAREVEREKAFSRERDSTSRLIRTLRARVQKKGTIVHDAGTGTDTVHIIRTVEHELTDSLIAAYDAGRRQDSLQLLFWRGQVAQRDSIIPRLQQARDSWRKQAQRPRHTVTDILGGGALGYALAENDEIAAGLGGALIVVPRVLDVLGRVF